ncbi:D-alanyl-D-alanine carboxypeptidase family protein [Sphingomonas sp. GC_Shp_3]|uniref:D-alanyl-D-alanine carboxypeptidase family protein n=1 Tax=Sphingomonas sp. GC_Shp_3 TaxID=2937383 RepID=UPI00226ADDF2|nr:D-alanyl-D-alanine carboxypeptidase family protein [Sphingomonas sp. GC_Shp_3]
MFCLARVQPGRLFATASAVALALAAQPALARRAAERPVSEMLFNVSSGKLLYAEQPDVVRHPASLTKMMTLYLLFDALDAGKVRLDDAVPVSRNAARQPPSRLGVPAGRSVSVRTAISAMAVRSSNDMAVAIAEKLAGSEARFATLMTAKARQLGMRNTSFANASGLTNSGNLTTARDMTRLAVALLKNHPRQYPVFSARSITWQSHRLASHDHLLGKISGVDGIKTGYTVDSGYNIVTSADRGGVRIIAVVLGDTSVQARDLRVANLVELGFTSPPTGRRRRR